MSKELNAKLKDARDFFLENSNGTYTVEMLGYTKEVDNYQDAKCFLWGQLPIVNEPQTKQALPNRLSNQAYKKAKELNYDKFVSWWDEQII